MRRVVGRKLYDTETAERLWGGPYDMGHGPGDNSSLELYRSPQGQLFTVLTERVGSEEGTEALDVIDGHVEDLIVDWLERTHAPASVYEATGIEVKED